MISSIFFSSRLCNRPEIARTRNCAYSYLIKYTTAFSKAGSEDEKLFNSTAGIAEFQAESDLEIRLEVAFQPIKSTICHGPTNITVFKMQETY